MPIDLFGDGFGTFAGAESVHIEDANNRIIDGKSCSYICFTFGADRDLAHVIVTLSEQEEKRSLAQWAWIIKKEGTESIRGIGATYGKLILETAGATYPALLAPQVEK